jgi:hypothetical protein
MSEVMLQRSISASSLLKQAAASIEAQGRRSVLKKSHERTYSDFVPGANSEVPSRDQIDYFTSRSTSGTETPSECREKRHIRFADKVEQCIAVDCKRMDEDDDEAIESETTGASGSDSEDDGMVMMKRLRRPAARRGTCSVGLSSRNGSHSNLKTIETLPATTLKYKREPDEEAEPKPMSGLARSWSSSKLSPSASQETLRPTRPSRNFLLGQDEDEDESAATSGWSFGASNPKSSLGAAASPSEETPPTLTSTSKRDAANAAAVQQARLNGGYAISRDSFDDDDDEGDAIRSAYGAPSSSSSNDSAEACEMEGMRRTESGMFMPYEEDEDDLMAAGMFGKISETVNTARDIAHVLWNVGWRK